MKTTTNRESASSVAVLRAAAELAESQLRLAEMRAKPVPDAVDVEAEPPEPTHWEPGTKEGMAALRALEESVRSTASTAEKAGLDAARAQGALDAIRPHIDATMKCLADVDALQKVEPEDMVTAENLRRTLRAHETKRDDLVEALAEAQRSAKAAAAAAVKARADLFKGRFTLAVRELHGRAEKVQQEFAERLEVLRGLTDDARAHGLRLEHSFDRGEFRDTPLQTVARGVRRIAEGLDLAP